MRSSWLGGLALVVLGGCQLVSGLSGYEATERGAGAGGGTSAGGGGEGGALLPETQWARSYGGPGDEVGTAIALDVDGSTIFGGGFNQITFDGSLNTATSMGNDAFFAKLDRDGGLVWHKVFGGAGDDRLFDLKVDPSTGRIAVVGLFEGSIDFGSGVPLEGSPVGRSIFVAVFEPNRDLRWAQAIGGNEEVPTPGGLSTGLSHVAFAPDGDVLVTGALAGQMEFPAETASASGDASFFVLRLDAATGDQEWLSTASIVSPDLGLAEVRGPVGVGVADDGDVLVAGTFTGELTVDGGASIMASGVLPDGFLLKIPTSGAPSVAAHGGVGVQVLTSMSVLASGDVILGGAAIGGYTSGPVTGGATNRADLFVARVDRDGVHRAAVVLEGTPNPDFDKVEFSSVTTLDVDSGGDVVVAGTLWGELTVGDSTITQSPANYDMFVLRLDDTLAPLSVRRYGDPELDFVLGSALDDVGRIVLTGLYTGNLSIAEESFSSAGSADAFVAKLVVDEGS